MRQALDKTLRSALESTVIKARDIAEQAAKEAIERLGVGEPQAPSYLTEQEASLRVKLRAHGRQLGDNKHPNGEQEIDLLISESAYQHWHRMLFARFLEQNNLLMYDAHTSVTLEECGELAADAGFSNGWAYASHLASKMLPQVFRQDTPVFELELAINHIRDLEAKVAYIPPQTFQAQDALGWVYQFWQTKRKQEVNSSGVKIGARELSPVTQLFTEPYMVSFLLDNALGAWWANRKLTANDIETAKTEQDLRDRAAIPGVPLSYLRFVKTEAGPRPWQPAAGNFEQWPARLSELKTLDPCCGSGHFLVAAFLTLVPMRMADEGLSAPQAVDAVLSQNIHGLELDQRCVELAAFALALEAWRYPNTGGYRPLPELHVACSGLSVKAAKQEWKQLGLGKKNLEIALDWLYQTFADAPVLGSLINPRKSAAAKIIQWDELEATLQQALSLNANGKNEDQHEAGIVAQGLAKAATLLAGQYSWVITNVPYLARGKQSDKLKSFSEHHYPAAKNDLATVFLDRCLELCGLGGTTSVVLTQNWLFLTTYKSFREELLARNLFNFIVRLGGGAEAFGNGPGNITNIAMMTISRSQMDSDNKWLFGERIRRNILNGLDVSEKKNVKEKAIFLKQVEIKSIGQAKQLENPDARITFDSEQGSLLTTLATNHQGLSTGDNPRFRREHWEVRSFENIWSPEQSTVTKTVHFGGRNGILLWEKGVGQLHKFGRENVATLHNVDRRGEDAWGKVGVGVSQMGLLSVSLYNGSHFDTNLATIIPQEIKNISAIWCFCSSPKYHEAVRQIDQKLNVTNATLVKVPFDLDFWSKIAEEKYPNGLPLPYTNDPTQWIFHGHPCGSVIWHEQDKVTAIDKLRKDETVLQIGLARLLGYQWPAELDPEMELAEEQRQWVNACKSLVEFIDDDGIICIPAVRGEKPAAARLEAMLEAAYGEAWSHQVLNELLAAVNASSLEAWLRDKFFEQHCKLFSHRPFIWQIWDGLKDGFSVLVNYHKLDADNLDRLIYTYLGDWIRAQEQGIKNGIDGADIRLAAAQNLHAELEAIKVGEAAKDGKTGYDIFVRWKPLHEQPIGWNPDLNDGVRLNIRPFMAAKDMGKRGAGILRAKPNIHWKKDRGTDVESAPWYHLGEQYGEPLGARINDHHLTCAEKLAAREKHLAEEAASAGQQTSKNLDANQQPGQQGRLL